MQTLYQVFDSVLSIQDMKQHLPYRVEVPAETRSLTIRMSYAPMEVEGIHNLLTLTVIGPDGFRGAAHRHEEVIEVVIQEDGASPGFIAGPLQPGEWTILVDAHMIMPGVPLHLRLLVEGDNQPAVGVSREQAAVPAGNDIRKGGRSAWYRGDFHAHSVHSDASWDVCGLVDFALANQLDFVTLSDHNTISGLAAFERACPPGLLPVCGSELTTFWGHALALGLRDWVDWRMNPGEREMVQIADEIEARGGLFVIAHPAAVGDPYCTGCRWDYPEMQPGPARHVEVWNSPWFSESNNEGSLRLAYQWMKRGLRMVLTAGTDRHGPPYKDHEAGFNIVYADQLSEVELLRAVRAGHLFLSSGPFLRLAAQASGRSLMVGDSHPTRLGEVIQLNIEIDESPPGSQLELAVDGELRDIRPGEEVFLPGGQTGWALLTLRGQDGKMLALTNPIYFDGR